MAVMSDLPKSVETREATFQGIKLRLHFLSDGQRIIEQAGIDKLMRAAMRGAFPESELERVMWWVQGDA